MQSPFRLSRLIDSSILYLYSEREYIKLDPEYQRQSDIWPLPKKQLLIDSLLNGFDLPKFYFEEFFPALKERGREYKYSIIDGKQRLAAIWDFIDGKIALSDDFEYFADDRVRAAGLSYAQLAEQYPRIRTRFDGITLSVITIQTSDGELIEEMFSRLNEAVPLNAPEKRNAFGGRYPDAIRKLVKHRFFSRLPFGDTRYRHMDLAAKFLLLESHGGPADTKKVYLDEFVKSGREASKASVDSLVGKVINVLERMADAFTANDALLKSVGMVSLYYLLFRDATPTQLKRLTRNRMLAFDAERTENRALAEENIAAANYDLLEFDRLAQSPNDGVAIEFRFKVLRNAILK